MSATQAPTIVTGVDFVSVPTRDLEKAVDFYGSTLGLRRSVFKPDRNFAEFETGAFMRHHRYAPRTPDA